MKRRVSGVPSGQEMEEENAPLSFRQALPLLFLLATVFFFNFTSRIIFSPLLPEIERDMNIGHTEAGSFFLVISLGYFISILLSGFVAGRIGHKRTIVCSAFCSGLTLVLIGYCSTLIEIRLGLFCLGYAAGLYLQSGLVTISRVVAPSHIARGIAVHELAPNIAFVAAPLLSALILQWLSWRGGLQLFGLVLCSTGLLYGLLGPGTHTKTRRPGFAHFAGLLRLPQFWEMVLLFSFAICATLGIYSMLPLYLVTEQGMEQQAANRLVALSRISSVFMPLVAGWFGDRFGNRVVMLGVLLGSGVLTIPLGVLSGYPLLAFVVLQPMVAVCFFPSGFAVLSKIGGPGAEGTAVPLCIPLAFLFGGGIIPVLIGFIGDYYNLAISFVAIGLATCLAASACIVYFLGSEKT